MSNSLTMFAPSQGSAKKQIETERARARSPFLCSLIDRRHCARQLPGQYKWLKLFIAVAGPPPVVCGRVWAAEPLVNKRELGTVLRESCQLRSGNPISPASSWVFASRRSPLCDDQARTRKALRQQQAQRYCTVPYKLNIHVKGVTGVSCRLQHLPQCGK
jgi:hypothetical protein